MYERFQKLLNDRHLRTSNVCAATGVTPTVMSYWKHGKTTPNGESMYKIAKFFDVPMEYFYEE